MRDIGPTSGTCRQQRSHLGARAIFARTPTVVSIEVSPTSVISTADTFINSGRLDLYLPSRALEDLSKFATRISIEASRALPISFSLRPASSAFSAELRMFSSFSKSAISCELSAVGASSSGVGKKG